MLSFEGRAGTYASTLERIKRAPSRYRNASRIPFLIIIVKVYVQKIANGDGLIGKERFEIAIVPASD